jgi:hypothetical protein
MKTKLLTIFFALILIFSSFLPGLFNLSIKAQGLCDFIPCADVGGCPNGDCASAYTDSGNLIKLGLTLVFVAIIALGVILIIRAVFKIVRSEVKKFVEARLVEVLFDDEKLVVVALLIVPLIAKKLDDVAFVLDELMVKKLVEVPLVITDEVANTF